MLIRERIVCQTTSITGPGAQFTDGCGREHSSVWDHRNRLVISDLDVTANPNIAVVVIRNWNRPGSNSGQRGGNASRQINRSV